MERVRVRTSSEVTDLVADDFLRFGTSNDGHNLTLYFDPFSTLRVIDLEAYAVALQHRVPGIRSYQVSVNTSRSERGLVLTLMLDANADVRMRLTDPRPVDALEALKYQVLHCLPQPRWLAAAHADAQVVRERRHHLGTIVRFLVDGPVPLIWADDVAVVDGVGDGRVDNTIIVFAMKHPTDNPNTLAAFMRTVANELRLQLLEEPTVSDPDPDARFIPHFAYQKPATPDAPPAE